MRSSALACSSRACGVWGQEGMAGIGHCALHPRPLLSSGTKPAPVPLLWRPAALPAFYLSRCRTPPHAHPPGHCVLRSDGGDDGAEAARERRHGATTRAAAPAGVMRRRGGAGGKRRQQHPKGDGGSEHRPALLLGLLRVWGVRRPSGLD